MPCWGEAKQGRGLSKGGGGSPHLLAVPCWLPAPPNSAALVPQATQGAGAPIPLPSWAVPAASCCGAGVRGEARQGARGGNGEDVAAVTVTCLPAPTLLPAAARKVPAGAGGSRELPPRAAPCAPQSQSLPPSKRSRGLSQAPLPSVPSLGTGPGQRQGAHGSDPGWERVGDGGHGELRLAGSALTWGARPGSAGVSVPSGGGAGEGVPSATAFVGR